MINDMIIRGFYMENRKFVPKRPSPKVEKISFSEKINEKKNNFSSNGDDKNYSKKKGNNDVFMKKDTCEISEEAKKLYELAKKAVDEVPDIREDKVNDIKKRIEDGTYDVTAEDLANKLIKNN